MLVIGEKINATNKSVGEAIARRDVEFIAGLAKAQDEAGANYIDVNAGAGKGPDHDEAGAIGWLVEEVLKVTAKPLTIDSESPGVIEKALRRYRGEDVMINSVSAEKSRLESVGALVAEHKAKVVALAMGDEGIPPTAEKRLEACEKIATHLSKVGVKIEQIFFDPLVLPISSATNHA